MNILNEICIVAPHRNDVKYDKQDSIQHCWQKADILPFNWNTMIDQALGTTSISTAMQTLSSEDCDDLCHLMSTLMTWCQETNLDTNEVVYVLQDSFAGDNLSHDELVVVVEAWANIEDNDNVVEIEMDEAFGMLNSTSEAVIPLAGDDPMDVCHVETANQNNEAVNNELLSNMNITELLAI